MPPPIWFAPWKPGPGGRQRPDAETGPILVSVTEFTARRPWTAVGVASAGMTLRRSWGELDGAVGVWLWASSDLRRPRSGAVSVWRDMDALHGFVARPDHLKIVRAYRNRGTLRSTAWEAERFDRRATLTAAQALLVGEADWPEQ